MGLFLTLELSFIVLVDPKAQPCDHVDAPQEVDQ